MLTKWSWNFKKACCRNFYDVNQLKHCKNLWADDLNWFKLHLFWFRFFKKNTSKYPIGSAIIPYFFYQIPLLNLCWALKLFCSFYGNWFCCFSFIPIFIPILNLCSRWQYCALIRLLLLLFMFLASDGFLQSCMLDLMLKFSTNLLKTTNSFGNIGTFLLPWASTK